MRKVHITIADEVYQALRELAYTSQTSISACIDVLIGEALVNPKPNEATVENGR
jgi:predicted CopG family antitoxin